MLHFKNRQSKFKRLQEARRAYVEQVAFIRQFRRDEDGGLIVLTLLLLISMLVVGGMAVDFMRFESERTKLQSVSDRAVLAAANLNESRDPATIITDFFTAEGYAGAIVGAPAIDKNANGATITLNSSVDVDTFYLRLIGMDTLTAPASASAIEGSGNVEVSLVLDISGSMGRSMEGQANVLDADGNRTYDADGNVITETRTASRMWFLQQAAKDFIDDLLLPEYENRISINLVAYSQHVRLGDDLYMALRTTPDTMRADDLLGSTYSLGDDYTAPFEYTWVDAEGNPTTEDAPGAVLRGIDDSAIDLTDWADGQLYYTNPSRCVLFEEDEFETLTFDVGRLYTQVEHVDFYGSGENFWWEPCSRDAGHSIILMSQNADQLKDAIDSFYPTVNTSIHRGMKWGASLLDPSMRPIFDRIPTIDDAFRGTRPVAHNDTTTQKYLIIMTDGQTVSSRRIKRSEYGDAVDYYDEYDERRGFADTSGRNFASSLSLDFVDDMSDSIGSVTDLNLKLTQMCDESIDAGIEVYTISMGLYNATMRDCPEDETKAFQSTITNDPDQPGLGAIFSTISDQITALRLSL